MALKILIIDDDFNIGRALAGFLEDFQHHVKMTHDGISGLQTALEEYFDLIFLDVKMPGKDGMQVLESLKKSKPDQTVIMISGQADLETAVRATKLGAYNFLEKPLNPDKVVLEVKNVEKHQQMAREVSSLKKMVDMEYQMVGNSPALEKLRQQIERAAPSDGRILIFGENGTGKELVAREIHAKSRRRTEAFIKVNCAAIPRELIESELFGYEKGAFTGAVKRKSGMFEEANKGTLLLDEVGDLSLESQAKLLRVLQENEFMRVGGTTPIKFDIRIISATNKDLRQEIDQGHFREDLFFRLNVIPIIAPALRERKSDIPILARHFLSAYCLRNGKKQIEISEQVLEPMLNYHWPGNIRELRNYMERLVIMAENDRIDYADVVAVFPESGLRETQPEPMPDDHKIPLRERLENFEKQLLTHEFRLAGGNVSRMAATLQTDRPNLHRKLKKYGIKA
ncbi:MAG: sigma-54-dependent transcriptional regulator [Candidatus Zhuqueibacterota bacterium]